MTTPYLVKNNALTNNTRITTVFRENKGECRGPQSNLQSRYCGTTRAELLQLDTIPEYSFISLE